MTDKINGRDKKNNNHLKGRKILYNLFDTVKKQETAVMVGIMDKQQDEIQVKEYLDELSFLIETAGAVPLKRFIQRLAKPDPKTFIGSGKLDEIREYIKEHKVDIAVFDDELSPSQLRNIE